MKILPRLLAAALFCFSFAAAASEVSTWSTTSDNNNATPPNGWPEGMQYSQVNNTGREMMGSIARWRDTLATKASPTMTGTPTAPTATTATNSTQIATTAYVVNRIANDAPTKTGSGASGTWAINISGAAATAAFATNATYATSATNATNAGNAIGTLASKVVKAWALFNGAHAGNFSPDAGYGISSITKASTGIYTLNFSSVMANQSYAVVCMSTAAPGDASASPRERSRSVYGVQIEVRGSGGGAYDGYVSCIVIGGG